MMKSGSVSNARVYRDVRNIFKNYTKKEKLSFNEIDYKFLVEFETFKKTKGTKGNTISYYLRTLRSLFNMAIKEKQCPKDCYPFNDYKIGSLQTPTKKRAISHEDIKRIEKHPFDPNTKQQLIIHLFMFSFYTMGMNYNDMAKLKIENIQRDRIVYFRSKTKKDFSIKILPQVRKILDFYLSFKRDSKYIFPILDEKIHNTPEKIRVRISSGRKRLNKHLKKHATEEVTQVYLL
jgi:integrase/recombinase XerD